VPQLYSATQATRQGTLALPSRWPCGILQGLAVLVWQGEAKCLVAVGHAGSSRHHQDMFRVHDDGSERWPCLQAQWFDYEKSAVSLN